MSPIKETNYFSSDIDPLEFNNHRKLLEQQKMSRINYNSIDAYLDSNFEEELWGTFGIRELEQYRKLFRLQTEGQIAGEVSNSYLYSSVAFRNMYELLPNSRILFVLRDPIDRLVSHYMAAIRDGITKLPLEAEIQRDAEAPQKGWYISELYLELGLYHQQISKFFELFPKSQLKVLISEELKRDPQKVMSDVFHFLGVDDCALSTEARHNVRRSPRSVALNYFISQTGLKKRLYGLVPYKYKSKVKNAFFSTSAEPIVLSKEFHAYLKAYYEQDVQRLFTLLDLDDSPWRNFNL